MNTSKRIIAGTAALAALAIGAGPAQADATTSVQQLRQATARYHDVAVAEADGYFDPEGVCEPNMGFHYGNFALFDGEVDPAEPEVLLYEPSPEGRRLVGAEYIAVAPVGEPPELFGQTFSQGPEIGDGLAVYALHVYAWRHNPAGTFAPYNPKVSC